MHSHLGLRPNISSTLQYSQERSIREDFLQEEAFFWDLKDRRLQGNWGEGTCPHWTMGEGAINLEDSLLWGPGQALICRWEGGCCQGGTRMEQDKTQLSSLCSAC